MTSKAPGSGTSISSIWKASLGSPKRSSRITQAAIVAGSSPGSVLTSDTRWMSIATGLEPRLFWGRANPTRRRERRAAARTTRGAEPATLGRAHSGQPLGQLAASDRRDDRAERGHAESAAHHARHREDPGSDPGLAAVDGVHGRRAHGRHHEA